MKVLFIGNSYTYYHDLPALVGGLARENGKTLSRDAILCGGRKLFEYLDIPDDYTDMVKEAAEKHYDAVFLQEQSYLPLADPARFMDGVARLKALFTRTDRFILYQTWGRQEGSPLLKEKGWTSEGMTEGLRAAYRKAAETYGMTCSPVGTDFLKVQKAHPEAGLYACDGSHPSYLGSCLAAVTHYRALFGEKPAHILSLGLSEKDRKVIYE